MARFFYCSFYFECHIRRMFVKTTHDICVSALPLYLEDQSDPKEEHFVWAYTIHVENHGDKTVQLINRHWEVTDSHGQTQHVDGAGVVGEQPTLEPGQGFQYTSGTVLATASGYMVGSYEMEDKASGARFMVEIPAFSLDSPHQVSRPN